MRRIGLYSLIAFASLALVGLMAAGVVNALNQGDDDRPIEQANTPTVSEPPEPETKPEDSKEKPGDEEKSEDKEAEKEAEEREAAEQEAAEQEAAEQAAVEQEDEWREIAEQRAAEEAAAAEQAAAEERAAAEQAAAEEEAASAQPAAPSGTALSLSVPSIGIQNNPVSNSVDESVLSNGAGKLPQTGFPWQQGSNTYIAAHVYGYPGTGSWQQFADVPNMQQGDEIFLTDSDGTTYEYRVSEIVTVAPTDVWVAQSTGQDMVSLQTCVGPGWSERLVVRGEMVGSTSA